MSSKFNTSISLEKFSAFLDGNLPDSEMIAISKEIAKDDFLRSLVSANAETDEIMACYSDEIELDSIDESTFELPPIEVSANSEENFELGDIWIESAPSLPIDEDLMEENLHTVAAINESIPESSFSDNILESSHHFMKDNVNYGYEPNHEDSTFDWNIYQGNQPTCAIRSQEIIMRDYGVAIPQEELIAFAQNNGWYDPDPENGGTPRDATGNLLDAVGIETKRYDDASIFDIISELRAGHRVIVSVDANELWVKNEPKLYKRIFGELSNRLNDKLDNLNGVQGANHALIVAGVNVNPVNPSDMRVVLIDSGSGDVCIEYSFKDFKKAWDDSHCHMVTTTEPAPYQYNYHTHQMEPSNFSTDFIPATVSLPDGLDNEFHLPEKYYAVNADYTPRYNGNIDLGDIDDTQADSSVSNVRNSSSNSFTDNTKERTEDANDENEELDSSADEDQENSSDIDDSSDVSHGDDPDDDIYSDYGDSDYNDTDDDMPETDL